MSTVVEDMRTAAAARLRELEAERARLEDEAAQLREVLRALDERTARAGQARSQRRGGPRAGAPRRAPQGANKRRILEVVEEHPGISAAKAARLMDRPRTVIASTMTRMKNREGLLEAHGDGMRVTAQGRAELARLRELVPA